MFPTPPRSGRYQTVEDRKAARKALATATRRRPGFRQGLIIAAVALFSAVGSLMFVAFDDSPPPETALDLIRTPWLVVYILSVLLGLVAAMRMAVDHRSIQCKSCKAKVAIMSFCRECGVEDPVPELLARRDGVEGSVVDEAQEKLLSTHDDDVDGVLPVEEHYPVPKFPVSASAIRRNRLRYLAVGIMTIGCFVMFTPDYFDMDSSKTNWIIRGIGAVPYIGGIVMNVILTKGMSCKECRVCVGDAKFCPCCGAFNPHGGLEVPEVEAEGGKETGEEALIVV